MSGFLGVPGAMVELRYRGGLSVKTDRPVRFTRTLGGKRKAFLGRRARREWSVSFDLLSSRDVAGLVEIARSAGEVMWYPADSAAGNLLSPQASGFEMIPANAMDAGLVQLPDGAVARTVVHSGSGRVSIGSGEIVPLRAGVSVTVGVWALGGCRFWGTWRDATGASLGAWSTAVETFPGWQWRESIRTPPAGATGLDLEVLSGTQYALPSVAWGSVGQDRPGRGCPKAVVHGLSEALTTMTYDDAYGSIDVTITEVG